MATVLTKSSGRGEVKEFVMRNSDDYCCFCESIKRVLKINFNIELHKCIICNKFISSSRVYLEKFMNELPNSMDDLIQISKDMDLIERIEAKIKYEQMIGEINNDK
jgi:hypothetical protein